MRKTIFASAVAIASVTACATPGIDYEARLMPASVAAAETKLVQVDRFRGPAGGWYASRFEAMLANTTFDGLRWFQLADFRYAEPGDVPAGTYTGDIDIVDYSVNEYYQTVSKCTEWDGLFDCETREDVEELCISEQVRVSVTPRLIDAATGRTVFSGTYGGDAGRETCDDNHYHGGGLFGFVGGSPPSDLIYEALSETLRPIRKDIAPRNATVRAEFITDAYDPVVKADPRFEQAVKAGARDPFGSCETWTALAAQYPEAPSVIHNMAACAEASHDFGAAQGLYAQAAELSVKYNADGNGAAKPFLAALRKLSEQRYGLELIDEISGTAGYKPVEKPEAAAEENAPTTTEDATS